MVADLPFLLLSLAIARVREAPLPHVGSARQLRRGAKVHPEIVRGRRRPTRLHAHKIAETNRGGEHAAALPPVLRQAATNRARRPARTSACATAEVATPNLPFVNAYEAQS